QTVSSANRTCFSVVSAVECTATVLMPSSRQARKMRSAISPRLAIRTLSSIFSCARELFFDDEERLAKLDRAAVLDEDADDSASELRLDLVHHLHRFDHAERVAGFDFRADVDERLGARSRAAVERSDHRGRDLLAAYGRSGGLSRCGRGSGRCRRRGGGRGRRRRDSARFRIAADTNGLLALGDLDLGDAGFLEELDELLYFSYIHHLPPLLR